MSLEFGWTPQAIQRVTLQQMEHYFFQSLLFRSKVPRVDMVVSGILASFGIRNAKDSDAVEQQIRKVSQGTISESARQAWEAAGMPSPGLPWMMQWMKEHQDGPGQSGSEIAGGPDGPEPQSETRGD